MAKSAIGRHELRSDRAVAFVNSFKTDNSGTGSAVNDNHLYAVIGREDDPAGLKLVESSNGSCSLSGAFSAGDGVWNSGLYVSNDGTDDETPPTASKTIQASRRFWATAIGAQKIPPSDIHLMVPRINWQSGETYNLRDTTSSTWYDAAPGTNDYYVLNQYNECWLLVAKDLTALTSTVEPYLGGSLTNDTGYLRDGKQAIFGSTGSGDKYVWRYLFKLTSTLINNLLLQDWMPVPYLETLWSPSSDPERTKGRDDAYIHLGCRHILIRSKLESGPNGSGKLPSGLRYRQIALVKNPVLESSGLRATSSVYYNKNSVNGSSTDQLRPFVGDMIYLENRSPIAREENQTEEFKTILAF